MITYRNLAKKPKSFKSVTGLSAEEFDGLCRERVHADAALCAKSKVTRKDKAPRQRRWGRGGGGGSMLSCAFSWRSCGSRSIPPGRLSLPVWAGCA